MDAPRDKPFDIPSSDGHSRVSPSFHAGARSVPIRSFFGVARNSRDQPTLDNLRERMASPSVALARHTKPAFHVRDTTLMILLPITQIVDIGIVILHPFDQVFQLLLHHRNEDNAE